MMSGKIPESSAVWGVQNYRVTEFTDRDHQIIQV